MVNIYGNPKSYFRDFCPLCGSRFYGDCPTKVYELIAKHCEDGTCEKNFRPFDIALADTGEDLK
jgi:hypothetical protein